MNTYKGKFVPKQHKKYKGDFNKITYRSSWEQKFMIHLDNNPNVVKWNSEEVIINYVWFEVKPFIQTQEPKLQGKTKKRQLDESLTYSKNIDKWSAAFEASRKAGVKFIILTEHGLKQLGLKL
mgnify:CR=1 FL=1